MSSFAWYVKKWGSVTHTQKKKAGKETCPGGNIDLSDKEFKAEIINMFKEIKEHMSIDWSNVWWLWLFK